MLAPLFAAKVIPLPAPPLLAPGTSPKARSAPSKPEPMTPLVTRSSEGFIKVFVTTWACAVAVAPRKPKRQTTREIKLIDLFFDGFIQAEVILWFEYHFAVDNLFALPDSYA